MSGLIAESGAWIKLQAVDAANSATVTFDGIFDSTYDEYAVVISSMRPQNGAGNLDVLSKTAGAYSLLNIVSHYISAGALTGSNGSALAKNIENSSPDGVLSAVMYISKPSDAASYKNVHGTVGYVLSGGARAAGGFYGRQPDIAALTGIRFQMSSGNILFGGFRLYGIKK